MMMERTSEGWPDDKSDGVEGEEPVGVAIEIQEQLADLVSTVVETSDADQGPAGRRDTGAVMTPLQLGSDVVNSAALPGYLQDVVASVIASMKAGNLELVNKLQESNQELLNSVEQKINRLQESNDQMRAEIRVENEKVVKRVQLETQKLRQDFSEGLKSETSKLSRQIRQVREDNERELAVVQEKFQGISSEFDARMGQQSRSHQEVTDELTSKIIEVRSEVNTISAEVNHLTEGMEMVKGDFLKRTEEFQKRQGERISQLSEAVESEKSGYERRFELLHSAINNLKDKLAEGTPVTDGAGVIEPVHTAPTAMDAGDVNKVTETGGLHCNCNRTSCAVCVNGCVVRGESVVSVRHPSANNYLSYADFPLPLFDDDSEVNPHLDQLDEFIRLRGVPKQLQLAMAFKSVVGSVGKQWVAAVARNLRDYDQFKVAFANTYWSRSKQSLVRCNLYQGRYTPQAGLSLSSYFLKYATMASYLTPKPSEEEIVEAVRHHFPVMVQRAMIGTQLRTVGETLDLLKRVEMMEADEPCQWSNPAPRHPNPIPNGDQHNRGRNERGRPNQRDTRLVQYDRRNNYNRDHSWRGPQGRGGFNSFARSDGRMNERDRVGQLVNPHNPDFAGSGVQCSINAVDEPNQHMGN
jgi:hypothetical protein